MEQLSFIVGIISLIVGIISIVLALVAMYSSKKSEQQSLHNFEKTQELLQKNYEATQKLLQDNYDKTKDLLAAIDKKAAVIDSVVQKNQSQMMDTLTRIVNETVIPHKQDVSEELAAQFLRGFISDSEQAQSSLKNLGALAELVEKLPKKKNEEK